MIDGGCRRSSIITESSWHKLRYVAVTVFKVQVQAAVNT